MHILWPKSRFVRQGVAEGSGYLLSCPHDEVTFAPMSSAGYAVCGTTMQGDFKADSWPQLVSL